MFNVFVSYSTHDLTNVVQLQQTLAGTGIEVFVAEHSVRPGEHLSVRISAAINDCDLFVVLWSENAKKSDWVLQEIGIAHSLNKPILPLVLTNGLKLPGLISGLKFLPLHVDSAAAIEEARTIVLSHYDAKCDVATKQKEKDTLILFGIGAFILWAFTQK